MPGRRRAREFALQVLYQADLTDALQSNAFQALYAVLKEDDAALAAAPLKREESDFSNGVVEGVWQDRARIDGLIEAASLHWRLSRMPIVDRNILRIACYEILARADIPISVTINEAVELAKLYGSDSAPRFINGVLGTLVDHEHEIHQIIKNRIAHETKLAG